MTAVCRFLQRGITKFKDGLQGLRKMRAEQGVRFRVRVSVLCVRDRADRFSQRRYVCIFLNPVHILSWAPINTGTPVSLSIMA